MIRVLALALVMASPAAAHDYKAQVKRWVDADTFDGAMDLGFGIWIDSRFRLMCINAPEKNTPEGQAMIAQVEAWGIERGTIDAVEQDAFGRILAYFTPEGWDETINKRLYDLGSPLYGRLTRADREICLEALQ